MFVKFENLPSHSRVWVYQSDRKFTTQELALISEKAIVFVDQWTKHGSDLQGSFVVKYNQFLILAVDEGFNNVSGCSIDASVRFVKGLEHELKLDLMNKMNITFRDNENINLVKLSDFQKFAKEQKVTSETIVFNNMVSTKEDFENNWEIPANDSWHKRFLV